MVVHHFDVSMHWKEKVQSSVLLFLSTKIYKTWGKVVSISIYKLSKFLRKDRSVKVTDKVKILESIQTVTINWNLTILEILQV